MRKLRLIEITYFSKFMMLVRIQIQICFIQVCNISFMQTVLKASAVRLRISVPCLKFIIGVQNHHGTRYMEAVKMVWVNGRLKQWMNEQTNFCR